MTVALPSLAQGSWQTYFGGRLNKASSSELDDDPTRHTGQTGNLRAPGFCLEVVQKTKGDAKLRSNLSPLQQNLNFNGAQWKRTTLGPSNHDVTSQLLKLYVQSLQICIKTQDLAKGYVQYGEAWEGLELFESMERQGVKPNEITFANVLRACTHILDLKQGQKCHSILRAQGYDSDIFVASSLVAMYTKLGHIVDARLVFNNIHLHHRGHVVLWNSIIAGYAQHGYATEVFRLFEKMLQECAEPDDVTFVSILSACNHAGLVDEGCQVFSLMQNFYGIIPGEGHFVCMVDLLGHVGQLYESLNLIYKMPSEPSVMVWMALVGACRIHGNIELAESSVGHVSRLEPQNIESLILLSNMYAAAGRWGDRLRVRTMIENMGL